MPPCRRLEFSAKHANCGITVKIADFRRLLLDEGVHRFPQVVIFVPGLLVGKPVRRKKFIFELFGIQCIMRR